MNTKTRFTNMLKKMVLPLIACGVMGVTGAYAQSGDIIGFYSSSANSEFTTPGATVEFTIRLYGTIVVSNLFNTTYAQPEIRMEVGSEGSSSTAYATLIRSEWTPNGTPYDQFTRTDLTFAYKIRPGDMADPLKIFSTASTGFTIVPNQCWIYKSYPGNVWSNVIWKVDNNLVNQPGDNGLDSPDPITQAAIDLSEQNIRIRTLSFDDANSPITIIARQPATTWRIRSGATNTVPVKVIVWTPNTNVLQIGSIPYRSLEVTIPAGMDYADFPIKGLDTNGIPTVATVYAQRPSDYKPPSSLTNSISRALVIEPPGEPTIGIEFLNGMAAMTLSETSDPETGSFRIVLSEPHTNRVYVRFDVANLPIPLTNIVITPQAGGYYVNAGAEKSAYYTFSAVNGTKESSRSPSVRITPVATNTTKYTVSNVGVVTVGNIPPTVQWYPPPIADENTPVAFEWSDLIDVDADLARGMIFKWNFGDGPSITQTNFTTSGIFNKTYFNIGDFPRSYTVTLTVTDADGGAYTLPSHTIVVTPAPKPANITVAFSNPDGLYKEGDTTAKYKVVLSTPALQNTYVTLKGQYLTDDSPSDDCLTLTVTNILIGAGLTNSTFFSMTIKDGTSRTGTGIQIIPTITNAASQAQYPGAYPGIVVIENVAPGIDANPTCLPNTTPIWPYNAIEMGKPFTFKYTATDINPDKTGTPPIKVEYLFDDGTTTNITGATGSTTKTFTTLGRQLVTMIARDKDGGETTLAFPIEVVTPPPPPSVQVVTYPFIISENDSSAKQLTVTLSQTPASGGITQPITVYLDKTPPPGGNPGAVSVPASVIFYASETTKQVFFTVQDGTPSSAISGFTITPRIAPSTAGSTLYTEFRPGQILIQNVVPRFTQPQDGSTNTTATVGQTRSYSWSLVDVLLDSSTLQLSWDWGDGTTSTTTGAFGSTPHTYTSPFAQVPVIVRATDKDMRENGEQPVMITFYVTVRDSKKVIALPIGPNTAGFNGYTELGTGTIEAPLANPSLSTGTPPTEYTFYFSADATTAQLRAIPNGEDANDDGKMSYFFAWDGPLAAFQNPKHVTSPIAPSTTIINLPTGAASAAAGGAAGGTTTLNGNMVQVSAIFTLEYHENDVEYPVPVNNGDLNQDGIPDRLVQVYFIDQAAAGGTDTALDPIWFENLGGFNEDEDYLPVYPAGDNQGVLDFRPVPNPATAANAIPVNAFTAFMEVRGYDGYLGTPDDPETDPTEQDTDQDGYPDGWEYWFHYQSDINRRSGSRFDPLNIAKGTLIGWNEIVQAFDPMDPRNTYTERYWVEDFDNDGLLDVEELVLGTDPTNWDTDRDIMSDGWEFLFGYNPQDARDGNLPSQNNPDGDYFAISTVPRVHLQVVTMSETNATFIVTTNHFLVALDEAGDQDMATLTTAYHYGDDTAPWAVGIAVDEAVLTPGDLIDRPEDEDVDALILHFQVRNEYGFDPRTAWVGTVGRFGAAYAAGGGAPAGWPYSDADRFGAWLPQHAPNTRPFTAIDEYLLMKFMYELQLNGMVAQDNQGWIERLPDSETDNIADDNIMRRMLIQESWTRFTTHPRTPDTDATPAGTDGVPDGWELYNARPPVGGPAFNAFSYSPWYAEQAPLPYQREYWGTDSLAPYQNANLYRFGMTDGNPMIGIVTIIRPVGHQDTYWVNKFWPTDPYAADTDGDGIGDLGEMAFMYGNAVDNGGICIAGGGLNPCSVDTDRDALPDPWEVQFAGAPVAADGTTTLPPVLPGQPAVFVAMTINNGQDGTVADENKDADYDGLVSYQEYMTQSLRGYRYDVPNGDVPNDEAVVDEDFTGNIGQPMDITFEVGVFFTEVVIEWDQSRLGWPLTMPLWWMAPAGPNGYCSTDPNNPDTDFDNMDDYYEMYHGLNPLLGNGTRGDYLDDRVAYAWIVGGGPVVTYDFNWWIITDDPGGFSMDFVRYPWLNGMPSADPDADGLLNLEEMLGINMPLPENQNTDPSPIWMTDPSNINSITARFYAPYGYTGYKVALPEMYRYMFFWPPTTLPWFTYQFEMNEGYDTDNDGVSDKDEQVTNRNAKSDPRDSEDPLRRQAIWFSGTNSAATTPYMYTDLNTVVGQSFADMEQAFRSFTVELWARPEWETSVNEQILIERAFDYGQSDASQPALTPRLRRNFQIGIAPDGRIFGGFDNAGGHDEHTDSVRLYGEKIVSNKWVHLAARMDGRTQKFTLFVNGVSQGEKATTLIPATGLDPARYYPTQGAEINISAPRQGSLIMGAANIELVSLGIGIGWELPLYYDAMTWGASWLTGYEKFYRGWIDEVRVWDGARSNQEINDNYRKPFTRDVILANRTLILEQLNNGAGRNALSTNNFLSPILMNYYTFNNLFSAHEEQYVAQVPRGFNSVAVNANRPDGNEAGAMVNWWDQCEVKNNVYNNWHYLPWIENVVAHLPRVTVLTDTNTAQLTFVNDNVVSDSIYWTRRSAGNLEAQNSFPNNNNPYCFMYNTTQAIDLLPIGDAWAKQCVDFWDDLGASGNWLENSGTTDDGLPQWWIDLHGTTGGWNALYNGTNAYYRDNGMTNGEVYQRDLAMGMLPSATNTTNYTAAYAQIADSNGDGIPDWWKRMYGLSIMDTTGESGPLGDPDKDALSNFAEYQITEVYKFRYSNPLKFKTLPSQPVSDYFMKPTGGKLIFGSMFSDHDFIEGWWEELYSPGAANPYVFDPKADYDADGWSNWAEARFSQAVATVRPDLRERVMVNGITTFEYPVPVVDTRLNYKGIQASGDVVIQAFPTPAMDGYPDATWNIAFGQAGVQQNSIPLGFYSDKTIRTRLSPGSVVPGTIRVRLTDTWTGVEAETGFDMDGTIYSSPIAGAQEAIGTIDYITGEMVFDMGHFQNVGIVLDEANFPQDRDSYVDAGVSYFEMTYDTKLPNGWPQHIYLGRAATGALKEGKNYFFAFIDTDGNGAWDAGEPAGLGTPFETDIGWDENALDIQLTDYTPNNLRLSLTTGLRSEDAIFGTGGQQGGGGQQAPATGYSRVRIIRATVQTSSFTVGPVFDKTIFGRDYIHEGDYMTMPGYAGYGLDWGFSGILSPAGVGAIGYKVYVGDNDIVTNNTLVAVFTNKFDAVRAVATTVYPAHGAYVYSARPTFSWSLTSTYGGYNAFAFELRRGSTSGPLVYPVTVRQVPLQDTTTGNYLWESPFYMGDKNTVNNSVYYWRVQMLNPKFSTVGSEWSAWKIFRWDVNQPMPPAGTPTVIGGSSSGYGQLRAVVKYFGAATTLADNVVLQAFNNRGFTGFPAAQYSFAASQLGLITNTSLSAANAIAMRGLKPGTYYVRAFIDSNVNGILDTWESWGYANYYGENKSLYDVRPVEVLASAISPLVTVYIEDCDTDQDWFPDAYEYQLNGNLTTLGPIDAWNYRGDSEINPNLSSSGIIAMMLYMTAGTSEQQDAFFSMAVDGDTTTTAATDPVVTIQSLDFATGTPTLEWALTPGQPAQSLNPFVQSLQGFAPMALSTSAVKTYTYKVHYSPTLGAPRPWPVVKTTTVTEDVNGKKTGESTVTDGSVTGTTGFFYVEVE